MIDSRRSPSCRRGRGAAAAPPETSDAERAVCFYIFRGAMHVIDDHHLPIGHPRSARAPRARRSYLGSPWAWRDCRRRYHLHTDGRALEATLWGAWFFLFFLFAVAASTSSLQARYRYPPAWQRVLHLVTTMGSRLSWTSMLCPAGAKEPGGRQSVVYADSVGLYEKIDV